MALLSGRIPLILHICSTPFLELSFLLSMYAGIRLMGPFVYYISWKMEVTGTKDHQVNWQPPFSASTVWGPWMLKNIIFWHLNKCSKTFAILFWGCDSKIFDSILHISSLSFSIWGWWGHFGWGQCIGVGTRTWVENFLEVISKLHITLSVYV